MNICSFVLHGSSTLVNAVFAASGSNNKLLNTEGEQKIKDLRHCVKFITNNKVTLLDIISLFLPLKWRPKKKDVIGLQQRMPETNLQYIVFMINLQYFLACSFQTIFSLLIISAKIFLSDRFLEKSFPAGVLKKNKFF